MPRHFPYLHCALFHWFIKKSALVSKWTIDPLALIASKRLSLVVQQDSPLASSPSYHSISPHAHLLVASSGGEVTASLRNSPAGMELQTAQSPLQDCSGAGVNFDSLLMPIWFQFWCQATLALCCYSHETLYLVPGGQGFFSILSRRHMSFKTMHISGCHPLAWSVKCPTPSTQLFRALQGFVDENISVTRKSHVTNFYLLCTSLKNPWMFYSNKFSASPLILWMPIILRQLK